MDLGVIIAIVGSAMSIIGVVIGMMFWVRSESNALRTIQHEDRKDILGMVQAIRNDMHSFQLAMQNETKDFHYRLLEIEKARK